MIRVILLALGSAIVGYGLWLANMSWELGIMLFGLCIIGLAKK